MHSGWHSARQRQSLVSSRTMRLLGPVALVFHITLLPWVVSPQRVYVRSPQTSRGAMVPSSYGSFPTGGTTYPQTSRGGMIPSSYGSIPSGDTTYHIITEVANGNIPSGTYPVDTNGNIIISGSAPISEWNFSNAPAGGNQAATGNKGPVNFVFLRGGGLRITLPEPVERSSVYKVKFLININKDFNGIKEGQWRGEVDIPRGSPLTYTFPDIKLRQLDTIYYWVIVDGRDGLRTWYRQYTGYYQVPDANPHGSGQPSLAPEPSIPSSWPGLPPSQPAANPISNRPSETPIYIIDSNKTPQETPGPLPLRPPSPPKRVPPAVDAPAECRSSSTTYNGNTICAGQRFDQFAKFKAIERFPDEHNPEESFTLFVKGQAKSITADGGTSMYSIVPKLLEEEYGPESVDKSLTLSQCTARNPELCSREASVFNILPPILSGRYTTEDSLSFKYGIVQVTAQLPKGDWIVPEIWLLPKNQAYGTNSGKIILAKSRGNRDLTVNGVDYSGRVLEVGVEVGSKPPIMFKKIERTHWFENFHTYKLIWTPTKLQFFVDDQEIGTIPARDLGGSNMQPFDQEFYLVLGVHVGGDKDFPDSSSNQQKPWTNDHPKKKVTFMEDSSRERWLPTWDGNHGLYVLSSSVMMTASDV